MSRTVELPDDLAEILANEAARLGMSLPDYAARLLASPRPPMDAIRTGSDLVAYWEAEGLFGSRPDIVDTQEYARQLREQSQRPRYESP